MKAFVLVAALLVPAFGAPQYHHGTIEESAESKAAVAAATAEATAAPTTKEATTTKATEPPTTTTEAPTTTTTEEPTTTTETTTTETTTTETTTEKTTSTRETTSTEAPTTTETTTTETTTTETTTTETTSTSTETTTTVTTTVTTTTTTTVDCFEEGVAWEPHMENHAKAQVQDEWECQHLCATTQGCQHFSLFERTMDCYLQDGYAIRRESRPGFVSGPFQCLEKLSAGEVQDAMKDAKLPDTSKCLTAGAAYEPTLYMPDTVNGTREEAITQCQKLCYYDALCAHYMVDFNLMVCRLAGKDAKPLYGFAGIVSGEPNCGASPDSSEHEFVPVDMPMQKFGARGAPVSGGQQRDSSLLMPAMGVIAAAGVAGAVIASFAARRSRRAVPRPESASYQAFLNNADAELGFVE